MDQYQHNVMTGQIPDVGFLPYSMPLDDLNYQVLAPSVLIPSSIKDEASDPSYVGALEDSGIPGDSQFYSRRSVASQSTSPPMSNSRSDLYNLQINNLPINSFDQVSPTATDQSRRESEDESQRAEVRRIIVQLTQMLTDPSDGGHRIGQRSELIDKGKTTV